MVTAPETAAGVGLGDSVSIAGVCLTVVEAGEGRLAFDVIPETLSRTALGRLEHGDSREPRTRRCASATSSAATSCRAMSTPSAVSALSSRKETAAASGSTRPRAFSATASRKARSRSRACRSPSRARRRRLRGRADPAHARGDDSRAARARRRGQPRDGRAREGRRAAGGGEAAVSSAVTPFASVARRSRTSARGRWWSSSTTRIARTRATSSAPRSSRPPTPSTSWRRTRAA